MAGEILIPFDPQSGKIFESIENPLKTTLSALIGRQGVASAATLQFLPGSVRNGIFRADPTALETEARLTIATQGRYGLAGTVTFSFGGETTKETTLAYLRTPYAIETALNGLDAIAAAGGVKVRQIYGRVFSILFNEAGARGDITITHSTLGDISTGRIIEKTAGDESTREEIVLDFRQSIVTVMVETDFSTVAATGSASVAVATTGTADTAQLETVTFSDRCAGGFWHVSHDGGTTWSAPLDWNATSYRVQLAMNELAESTWKVSQTKTGIYEMRREAVGVVATALQVDDSGLQFAGGKSVTLDLEGFRGAFREMEDGPEPGEAVELELILTTADDFDSGLFRSVLIAPFELQVTRELS